MTANPHLAAQLDDFAELKAPGFAIMITAPWGAGKTYAVKKWLGDRDHLYVSLFGIDSLTGVEEALFEAALEAQQKAGQGKSLAKSIDSAARIVQGAIKAKTGATFDATGLVRKAVLAGAPRLLVLDDLERAQLDPPRLLSIVNRFVEHEGKTVLLLANEDELERAKDQPASGAAKSDYRRWREKVVGRTITLKPDTEAALDAFLAAVPDQGARQQLEQRREAILDVFSRSETANLRLLRLSLIECGRFLARVPKRYLDQQSSLTFLIGDFLALSLDWHVGDRLTVDDFNLLALASLQEERRNNPDVSLPGLVGLRLRHEDSAFTDLVGRYFPLSLASKAIVEGYASDNEVCRLLRDATSFSHELEEDGIQTIARWYEREEASVTVAYHVVRKRISEAALVEPFQVLRAWDSLLSLSHEGLFGLSPERVVTDAMAYIDRLSAESLLLVPDDDDEMDRWSTRSHQEGADHAQIRDYLHGALITSQENDAARRLRVLLDDLKSDPYRFYAAIIKEGDIAKRVPNLSKQQVFLAAKATEVADEVFSLPPDRWRCFLSPMKRRQRDLDFDADQEGGRPNRERQWLVEFRQRAHQLAGTSDPIPRAQILKVVKHYLSFLDAPPPKANP